jgi:hypothetical protein
LAKIKSPKKPIGVKAPKGVRSGVKKPVKVKSVTVKGYRGK